MWWRSPVVHLQVLIVLAIALGGGGVGYGMRNAVIQLAALAICAAHPALVADFFRKGPRLLIALVLVTMAVPLVQLVPLPPGLWQSLPAREMTVESLRLAGMDPDVWRPLTVDDARTLVAFCGTLAPAAIIAIGARLDDAAKLNLVLTFCGAALAAILLGIVQISAANSTAMLFPINPKEGVLYASFANRNSTGLFFVIAVLLVSALPVPRRKEWLLAIVAVGSMLFLGAVLTQSRSSLVLLALPMGLIALRVAFGIWTARKGREPALNPATLVASGFALLIAILAVTSFSTGGRVGATVDRFANLQEDRLTMWEDGQFAAVEYWPVGSGVGTFDEVYQVYESLEYVTQKRAGRMHNDYLEVMLETGGAGLVLALLWLLWCFWQPLIGKARGESWLAMAAGIGIAAIALQSVLDYPLRNQTMLCVAALLVVLLVRPSEARP